MKGEDLKIGRYYLVQSNQRLSGGKFIGQLAYIGGWNVKLKKKTKEGTWHNWWTHKRYVIEEVPEHEAILELML